MKLIEKVKRRVTSRLWEDAEQDRLFRQQAIDVYQQLVEFLRSGGELKEYGRAVTIDQFADLEKEAATPLKIRFEEEAKSDSANAVYRNERDGPVIVMFVLEKSIYNSQKKARQDMVRGLQDAAKIFMHEYIHYLDDRRTEADIGDLTSYKSDGNKKMSTYFSDSFEINAFFQSGLAELEHTLEVPGLLDTHMERDWNHSFRKFKDWFFDEHIPAPMQYNMSDDQEKRLINRLYGFWGQIEDRYEETS